MLSYQVYSSFSEAKELLSTWRSYSNISYPFQLPEWQESWWNAFGTGRTLFLWEVKDNGHLIAIVPLVITKQKIYRLPFKCLSLLGSDNMGIDYSDLILFSEMDEKIRNEIISTILSKITGYDIATFLNIRDDSLTLPILRSLASKNSNTQITTPFSAHSFISSSSDDFNKLLKKSNLLRPYKYFSKQEGYTVRHLTKTDEILPLLESFFAQHRSRRDLLNDQSQFADENQKEFYRQLTKNLSSTQKLLFTELTINNDPIAYHFGMHHQRVFYWYKPTFNPTYQKHSPGKALLYELITWCKNNQIQTFDFTVGDEAFKLQYANKNTPVYSILIPQSFISKVWIGLVKKLRTRRHL